MRVRAPHVTPNILRPVAQLAEQLLRKQHVVGSSPTLGSIVFLALVAERLKALVCKTGERRLHVSSNLTECSNTFCSHFENERSNSENGT
jgi:hypothetical protein